MPKDTPHTSSGPPSTEDINTTFKKIYDLMDTGALRVESEAELAARLESEREEQRHQRRRQTVILVTATTVVSVLVVVSATCLIAPMFGVAVPSTVQDKAINGLYLLTAGLFGFTARKAMP